MLSIALLLPACGEDGGLEPSGGGATRFDAVPTTTPDRGFVCNPILPDCLTPFPSNLFTQKDEGTETGIRVDLSPETLKKPFSTGILDKASRLLQPEVFNRADGFSPLGLIIIPLNGPVDPGCLPDPDASVFPSSPIFLLDMATGERVPIHVQLDQEALRQDPPRNILVVTSRDRVDFGSTLLMVLTRGLRKPDGSPLDPIAPFEELKRNTPPSDPGLREVQELYRPVFRHMEERLHIDLREVLLSFDFTTRSEPSLTAIPLEMRRQVLERAAANPPVFHVEKIRTETEYGPEAVEVLGRYASPGFRGEDHALVLDTNGLPVFQGDDEIDVLLLLPRTASHGPVPVVVFGHGFFFLKESMIQCSAVLTEAGMAVVGIDIAAHGSRSGSDGFIGEYLNVESLFQMRDAILQTLADEIHLTRLIQGDLAELDVVPVSGQGDFGDGVPDLDPDRIFYISQSLGSMLGTLFLAYEPSVKAAVLNVPGGGLLNIFRNAASPLVGLFAAGFLPSEAAPLELVSLMAMEQMPFDLIDPLNYAHHVVREPLPGCTPKQVLLQQSMNDGLVPHEGTASLARGLGIPLVEPVLREISDVAVVPAPAASNGLFQFSVSEIPLLAHGLLLMDPAALRQILSYYASALETGTARIIDPPPADSDLSELTGHAY